MNLRIPLLLPLLIACPAFESAGGTVNHPPVGIADAVATPYGTPVAIAVLANDLDEDGDPLQIKFFTKPAAGSGSVARVGQNLVFTPALGFSGFAQFEYRTYDGMIGAGANTAVSVSVGPQPQPETKAVAFENGENNILPPGARWASFGIPSLYREGEFVGFVGKVQSRREIFSAIFSGPPNALQMRVRTGQAAPDRLGDPQPGVFFTQFGDPVFPQSPADSFADQETKTLFAVLARVGGSDVGTDTGLWMVPAPGRPFQLLAREGDIAPGTHVKFDTFGRLAMPKFSGRVFFTAKLRGAGLHSGNDAGLWVWTLAEGLRLVLRTGSLVDLQIGRSAKLAGIQVLGPSEFAPGRGGYERLFGQLDALLLFSDGESAAALIGLDGRIEKLVLTANPTGADNLVAEKFGMPAWRWEASGLSYPAVVARLKHRAGRVTGANDLALIDRRSVLARKGARTGIGASVFSSFADPVKGFDLTKALTLYRATIAGPGIDARNNTALFAAEDPDVFTTPTSPGTVIARTGGAAPGGGQFSRLIAHTIVYGRGPAFTAQLRLDGKTVTAATSIGFWATDTRGRISRILRTGDSVQVGSSRKVLRRFNLLGNVPVSPGQGRISTPGDPDGRIVYRAVFTDLTTAILTTTVP